MAKISLPHQLPVCLRRKFFPAERTYFGPAIMARKTDPPVVLMKWYEFTKWLLDRIDSFPKNQRFIFGQRLADHALDIQE